MMIILLDIGPAVDSVIRLNKQLTLEKEWEREIESRLKEKIRYNEESKECGHRITGLIKTGEDVGRETAEAKSRWMQMLSLLLVKQNDSDSGNWCLVWFRFKVGIHIHTSPNFPKPRKTPTPHCPWLKK